MPAVKQCRGYCDDPYQPPQPTLRTEILAMNQFDSSLKLEAAQHNSCVNGPPTTAQYNVDNQISL